MSRSVERPFRGSQSVERHDTAPIWPRFAADTGMRRARG